jgi:hypothetical protein
MSRGTTRFTDAEDGGGFLAFVSNLDERRGFVSLTEEWGEEAATASVYFTAAGLRQVARQLLELADELAECAHAYLDVGDTCAVCGGRITLDFTNGCHTASK